MKGFNFPVFLIATTVSWLLVFALRRWTEKRQMFDIPNERSSHIRPTPRGGGLAIVVVVISGWLIYGIQSAVEPRIITAYAMGAIAIAIVSWIDDIRSL